MHMANLHNEKPKQLQCVLPKPLLFPSLCAVLCKTAPFAAPLRRPSVWLPAGPSLPDTEEWGHQRRRRQRKALVKTKIIGWIKGKQWCRLASLV